ncbi:hypothetical protein [Micromonospora sp. HUAS LYJ1]|uniref:hypothetical protein n=1 Tax=Micromonospora sp. HUAS LYJ1 TaxID=3061626 RepID=UPI002671BB56|nr:hypothetical protein [Micromonospora sp. HUAS LYJ1]WKU05466.1 hypothetical protein Q2K16_32820 [Micromonospora sp. HUAS LYJ1]
MSRSHRSSVVPSDTPTGSPVPAGDNLELSAAAALRQPAPAPVMAAVVVVALYSTVQLTAIVAHPYLDGPIFKLISAAFGVLTPLSGEKAPFRGGRAGTRRHCG